MTDNVSGVGEFSRRWPPHADTVCLLSKLNAKQHIEVELTMDEMDLTAAEKKASYEEIKAYVLAQLRICAMGRCTNSLAIKYYFDG